MTTAPAIIVRRRPRQSESTPVGTSNAAEATIFTARRLAAAVYEPVTWAK
jgi:hypothetical protein